MSAKWRIPEKQFWAPFGILRELRDLCHNACLGKLGKRDFRASTISSKPFSVTVFDSRGGKTIIDGLSAKDQLAVLRERVANTFDIPQGLVKLSWDNALCAVTDYKKTLAELGVKDGTKLGCHCKNASRICGHLYTLTEAPVAEDRDIVKAVKAEFGNDGQVADFATLTSRRRSVGRDGFMTFLDELGPFLNAKVFHPDRGRRNQTWYFQRETIDEQSDDVGEIRPLLTLKEGAFYPMRVLVDLGVSSWEPAMSKCHTC